MKSEAHHSTTWIYHERQEALLCGQHALNNLLQSSAFSADTLSEIAHQLDEMELTYMSANNEGGVNSKDFIRRVAEGSGNVDASGNFSIEVLRSALLSQYELTLANIRQEGVRDMEITTVDGFVCNKESHWFAIRKINERYWNLNSTLERPQVISHFRLAAEIEGLQESGYSVFCIIDGTLPTPCKSEAERYARGLPEFWWKESDLLGGKGSGATTGATDPWRNVGSGMRLDGKSTQNVEDGNGMHIDGLTEDEMMQMALAASMQKNDDKELDTTAPAKKYELLPEPANGEKGAVRIQFRLPDGTRKIRNFLQSEPVDALFVFVEECCPSSDGKSLVLRAGFPPSVLSLNSDETIETAKLAGESVQCRLV